MTPLALLGLALLVAPFSCCGWAWVQWHREQLAARPLLAIAPEPDMAREELTVGVWEQAPWVTAA